MRTLLRRLRYLLRRSRHEADLREEMETHRSLRQAQLQDEGAAEASAAAASRRALGNLALAREDAGAVWLAPALEDAWRDVRLGMRTLRRSPGFTCAATATLAVAIGTGTLIFGLVAYALAGMPKPVRDLDRLVDIFTSRQDGPLWISSYPDVVDIQRRSTAFEAVVATAPAILAVNTGSGTRTVIGEIVTGNYFDALGLPMAMGRPLGAGDDRPGAPRAVVLSDAFWRRDFGARPDAVGQDLRIRGETYLVAGVASPELIGMTPYPAELWIPMAWVEDGVPMVRDVVRSPGDTPFERRGERWLFVKARLRSDRTIEQARAELDGIVRQLEAEYPDSNAGRRFTALPTRDVRIHPVVDPFLAPAATAILVVVALLVVVACANVMGMQLARATTRTKELGIRLALGGTRARLVRQLLTETLLVSVLGGLSGAGLAWLLLRVAPAPDLGPQIPIAIQPALPYEALWFALAAAIAAGMLSGLAPALRASRGARVAGLRQEQPSIRVRRHRWTLRDAIVVGQTTAAVVLLVTAALLTRSVLAASRLDPGFEVASVATVSADTSVLGYANDRAGRLQDEALTRLRALPAIEHAAYAWRPPLDLMFVRERVRLLDRHDSDEDATPIDRTIVSPEYFPALGIPILAGRSFTAADTATSPRVAVVSEAMARQYWGSAPGAIGQRFRLPNDRDFAIVDAEFEIVGVSADYKVLTLGEPPTPYIHYAAAQRPTNRGVFMVRTRAGAELPIDQIHRIVAELEPDLPFQASSMAARAATVLLPAQIAAAGSAGVGALAMVFAAIGLYGVVAFMVAQRRQEFGVRLAIGARPRDITIVVIRRGLALVTAGALLGALAAAGAAGMLAGALYGVSPFDPIAWSAAAVILFAIGLLAHALPARRASRIDPAAALRAE